MHRYVSYDLDLQYANLPSHNVNLWRTARWFPALLDLLQLIIQLLSSAQSWPRRIKGVMATLCSFNCISHSLLTIVLFRITLSIV